MAKIRIHIVFWFVLEYTIVVVSGRTERLTSCEDFERGNATFGCINNETIIFEKITYGESLCQDTSNSDICHSNISTRFNNNCLENNMCTLSIETLFNDNCKRPQRRLYVTFTCTWFSRSHSVHTCVNSLREVYCSLFQYIHVQNVTSDSECGDIDASGAIARLKFLCDDKRTCSPDTDRDSSLYQERFVIFSYGCTGTRDSVITEYTHSTSSVGITVIVVSTLVVTIVAAIVTIVIVCHRKKRAKNSKLCLTHNITTVTDRTNSSDYNIINLNQMTDIGIFPINDNTSETIATQHQQQNIKTANEHDRNMGNKYESISVNRNSDEHFYDSDSIHINQYESLKNPRESDKHTYESTEQALPQDINTSTEQEKNICNKYESLSTNRNTVEHVYESDLIRTNQYESFTKQRESDKHTYESTEQALPQDINTSTEQEKNICNKYESLSTNRNTVEHVYESDLIRTNQYESFTKQRESDKHTYESTEQALPQISKTLVDQEKSICNKYESLSINRTSDRHIYESDSMHTNKYESLTTQRESEKQNYESTEPA